MIQVENEHLHITGDKEKEKTAKRKGRKGAQKDS